MKIEPLYLSGDYLISVSAFYTDAVNDYAREVYIEYINSAMEPEDSE